MSKTTKLVASAALGIAALGAFAISNIDKASAEAEKEKCYGVAKAGANDCGSPLAGHTCAGHSTTDASPSDYINLPKGLCIRLVNGTLEAKTASTAPAAQAAPAAAAPVEAAPAATTTAPADKK